MNKSIRLFFAMFDYTKKNFPNIDGNQIPIDSFSKLFYEITEIGKSSCVRYFEEWVFMGFIYKKGKTIFFNEEFIKKQKTFRLEEQKQADLLIKDFDNSIKKRKGGVWE